MCAVDNCERVTASLAKDATPTKYCRMHHSVIVEKVAVRRTVKHGTQNEYQNYGCRCDACKAAGSKYNASKLLGQCPRCGDPMWNVQRGREKSICQNCEIERKQKMNLKHGTLSMYGRHKCRCDKCRAVSAASQRDYRRRKIAEDAEGFRAMEAAKRRRRKRRQLGIVDIDEIMAEVEEVLQKLEKVEEERVVEALDTLKPSVFVPTINGNGAPSEVPSFESRGEGKNLIEVVHQLLEGGSE